VNQLVVSSRDSPEFDGYTPTMDASVRATPLKPKTWKEINPEALYSETPVLPMT
jgi:hypothetical protein